MSGRHPSTFSKDSVTIISCRKQGLTFHTDMPYKMSLYINVFVKNRSEVKVMVAVAYFGFATPPLTNIPIHQTYPGQNPGRTDGMATNGSMA